MGKWAKAHTNAKKKGLTPKALAEIPRAAKDDLSPDIPGETPEERALRDRQSLELVRLDDEQNRKIKGMFAGSGGRRLFKSNRTGRSSGSVAASSAPATGPGSAMGGRPVSAGYGGSVIP